MLAAPLSPSELLALTQALEMARDHRGATSPNPPVGAAALDQAGAILSVLPHEGAGLPHAEARVLSDCGRRGFSDRIHTLIVTLEPCNHQGRTPPCTEAILRSGARRVVFATHDPNPRVTGQGAERLRQAGIEVLGPESLKSLGPATPLIAQARELIQAFSHWARTGMPWVTVKTAHAPDGSMIPPVGHKTFTSPPSLQLSHRLRRQADAILTGSGTVLADWPLFTVRHLPDHAASLRRRLLVLDRRRRVPDRYFEERQAQGLDARRHEGGFEEALRELGALGSLEVLVEAGPGLSDHVLRNGLWNSHVQIRQMGKETDDVHWHYSEGRNRS